MEDNRDSTSSPDSVTVPGRHRDRVRIVTLEAEIGLLERKRATLVEQIAGLESDVAALEEELATLEAATTHQHPELQQIINQYERIITNKDRAFQKHSTGNKSTQAMTGPSIIPTIKQLLGNLPTLRDQDRNVDD